MGIWTLVATIGTAASPALLDHPILIMAMAPRAIFVALAANDLDLASFCLLGTARLSITDPSYFLVGRRIAADGQRPELPRSPFGFVRKILRAMCSNRIAAAAVLLVRPNARYLAVAGANGIPAALSLGAALLGTVVYLVAMHAGVGLIF